MQNDFFAMIRFSPSGTVRAIYLKAETEIETRMVREAVDLLLSPSFSARARRCFRRILRVGVRAWRRCLEARIDPEQFDRRLSLRIDQAVRWEDRFR